MRISDWSSDVCSSDLEIGGFTGLLKLDQASANKMHLYLPSNHPDLPWTGIFTGLIIIHFFYWTTNQYQVQRVLAAETDQIGRASCRESVCQSGKLCEDAE